MFSRKRQSGLRRMREEDCAALIASDELSSEDDANGSRRRRREAGGGGQTNESFSETAPGNAAATTKAALVDVDLDNVSVEAPREAITSNGGTANSPNDPQQPQQANGMTVAVSDSNDNLVEHCHSYTHTRQRDRRAERVLIAVSCLTVLFVIAEFIGGFWAHSIAIMTDAGHMLSDLLGFTISITAIRCSRRSASKRLSFGWERAEILGALISVIVIWILTTTLIMLAIDRIVRNDLEVDANMMLITAGVGVLFNIIMGAVLHFGHAGHSHHGISHGHSHGHSHGSEASVEAATGEAAAGEGESGHSHKHHRNVNVRAALIHVIGDLLQSIGVLIASVVIKFTGWTLADPICTFLFAVIVLFSSLAVLRDIFYVLMEATPKHIDYSQLRGELGSLKGVLAVHNLHVWSLNMDKTALSVHLAIEDPSRATETVMEASRLVRTKHNVALATVQVEPFEKIMDSCNFCQPVVD